MTLPQIRMFDEGFQAEHQREKKKKAARAEKRKQQRQIRKDVNLLNSIPKKNNPLYNVRVSPARISPIDNSRLHQGFPPNDMNLA